jgi:hypothetical protein
VANLKTFWFDKASDRIVQQQTKKLLVTRKAPLSVVTETMVTEDVRKDPISIASVGFLHDGIRTKSQRPGP